jgi:hypothetical protein
LNETGRQLRRLWRSNFVGRKLGNLRRIANAVMFFFNAQPYFGGCNSLLSQPITFSVFRGSG